MRILLIGSYPHDRLESMDRFAEALENGLRERGVEVAMLRPPVIFGRLRPGSSGLGKWLGYLDKYLLFPQRLRRIARQSRAADDDLVVHVCDHSQAMFTRALQGVRHLVTCHDLLAIRSARGEFPENPVSWSGRCYQRLILAGLRRARRIASVSRTTAADLARLAGRPAANDLLILNGLNHPYAPLEAEARNPVLRQFDPRLTERSYVLHVGGNQWYKNRMAVARIYQLLRARGAATPLLVFAGQPPTREVAEFLRGSGLAEDIVSTGHATTAQLQALYSGAAALLFPSLAEGFGWPIIEAQACGCAVVTSAREPMAEIGGPAAVAIDLADEPGAAAQIEALLRETPEEHTGRITRGRENVERFSLGRMLDDYLAAYRTLLAEPLS